MGPALVRGQHRHLPLLFAAQQRPLVDRRDAKPGGLKLEYVRDPGTHALQAIRSGEAEIALHDDDQNRITRARGSQGQEIRYDYDSGGRLIRVTESSSVVRQYTYNKRGAMLTIDEPGRQIENRYDANGRCVHQ